MADRTLTCRDCNQPFVFTLGEQTFYTERGFSEPQRCPTCRQARKAQRNADGLGAGYGSRSGSGYGGSGSSSAGGSYSGDSSYGGGGFSAAPRQMFAAVCSNCGKETEVPFQPRNDRPVYCRECFQQMRGTQRSAYGD